ncbi:transketolase family protein [Candidatus Kaiserbacteria bacterium]|nr:transketolase family protein [Candidatus Kaiserbacteria bacterium]
MTAEHLNPNLFSDSIERVPNRNGFGEGLKEAGERDKNVVALCADLTESTRVQAFKEAFPERYIEIGVAEQNLASVASGMAAMGKIPFFASYAMFSPGRSWEQIRTTIAYNNMNAKIVGAHAGVSVGPDGATHQAIEDMAIMRVVPNMVVLAPCDVHEAKRATLAAAKYEGPVYIRLGREKTPVVTTAATPFAIGKASIYMKRDEAHERKVGIIATGTILHNALVAGKELNEGGIGASVMNLATVKPLDTEAVLAFAKEHDVIVTVEEHQVAGGMGSVVAEYLGEVHPTKVVRVGVKDLFGQSGDPDTLIQYYGIDTPAIVTAAKKALG